jgi:hypothetical protein
MTSSGVITAAEFRCLYEYLGLPGSWVADHLNVTVDDVRRWGSGHSLVPDVVGVELKSIAKMTADLVDQLARQRQWGGGLTTYRTDEEFRIADPFGLNYPASWHRAVAARVADRAVDVRIEYED